MHDGGLLVGLFFLSLAEADGKGIHSLKDSIGSILERHLGGEERVRGETRSRKRQEAVIPAEKTMTREEEE